MMNGPSERKRGVKNNFYWIELLIYGNKIMLVLNKNYFAKTNLPRDYLQKQKRGETQNYLSRESIILPLWVFV